MTVRGRWLPILLAGLLACAMVGAAQATGMSELLFPETLALLCGAWICPRQAWDVDRPRMLLLMGIGAVVGLCLNLLVPGPLWGRAAIAYALCAACMAAAGASMTPMLSAAILPVLLGTTSWLYPVVVVSLVAVVCLGQVALERAGLREPIGFVPRRAATPRAAIRSWGVRWAVFAVVSAPFYLTGHKLFCVPPLVVAYTSLSMPDAAARRHPWRTMGVLAAAGAVGGLGRAAVEVLGLPAVAVVAVGYVLLVAAWRATGPWLPPAGAVLLLAFLVPYAGPLTYAAEVAVGSALWVGVAMLFPGMRR